MPRLAATLNAFGLRMEFTKLANTWLIVDADHVVHVFGRVTDVTLNIPVVGATLKVSPARQITKTGEDGFFDFGLMPVGNHLISIEHSDYRPRHTRVEFVDGEPVQLDIYGRPR